MSVLFSIISISFATDFCLKDGLPPRHYIFVSKNTLKSPASKRFAFSFIPIVMPIPKCAQNFSMLIFSVRVIFSVRILASMVTFKTKIRPLLSHVIVVTLTSLYCLVKYAIYRWTVRSIGVYWTTIIFLESHSLLSRLVNGNILSTPSGFLRQCEKNIQNSHFCKRCHVRYHINWV